MPSIPTNSGIATYPPGATFGPRNLTDFEFVWVIEGNSTYTQDGRDHHCPAESIVLCTPHHTDFFRWDPLRPTRHAFFHFNLNPATFKRELPPVRDWPVVRPCLDGDLIRPLFRHLLTLRLNHKSTGETRLLASLMQSILFAFVLNRDSATEVFDTARPAPVERALAFLTQTLDADPSAAIELRDLARAANVTPEHLCRLFSKHTGKSPAQTVRLARLDKAANLLARTNFSIGQIATLTGFASQFHFSRAFKSAFTESPSAVRHRLTQGDTPPLSRLLRTE